MITTHNIDPGCCIHPSAFGFALFLPTASPTLFTAAFPELSMGVGGVIPLAGGSSAGPFGYVPGSPTCIAITVGTAVHSSTHRILGVNQFNKQVSEVVAPTAIGVTYTLNAYKQIISITTLTTPGAGTSSIAFGIVYGAGNKIALPFRPANKLQVAATLADWQQRIEVVGIVNPGTGAFLGLTPVLTAINERYATAQTNTLLPGVAWVVTNYINKGFRER